MSEKFSILLNDGKWSEQKYSLVEQKDDFAILQDEEGSKVRIFNDRFTSQDISNNISKNTKEINNLAIEKDINSNSSSDTKQPTTLKKEKPVTTTKAKATKKTKASKDEVQVEFDPATIFKDVSEKEVYEKKNSFNETTICKTYVIINLKAKKRHIVNTYDGIAKGGVEYPVKDVAKTVQKLLNDGYVKI